MITILITNDDRIKKIYNLLIGYLSVKTLEKKYKFKINENSQKLLYFKSMTLRAFKGFCLKINFRDTNFYNTLFITIPEITYNM